MVIAFEWQQRAANFPNAPRGIGRRNMKDTDWTTQAVCLLGLMVLSGCASTISPPTALTRLATNQDQATIQALQKRLQGRERTIAMQNYQIEVLSSQLDALKRIDQDTKVQRRPVSNLLNVVP